MRFHGSDSLCSFLTFFAIIVLFLTDLDQNQRVQAKELTITVEEGKDNGDVSATPNRTPESGSESEAESKTPASTSDQSTPTSTESDQENLSCPPKWQTINPTTGKCIRILSDTVPQNTVKSVCLSLGREDPAVDSGQIVYSLLTIESEEEQTAVNRLLFEDAAIVDNVWLGGVRQVTGDDDGPSANGNSDEAEGSFQWLDDSEWTYSNWREGSPSKLWENRCLQMAPQGVSARVNLKSSASGTGVWSDANCAKRNIAVCQRKRRVSLANLQLRFLKYRNESATKISGLEKKIRILEQGLIKVLNEIKTVKNASSFSSSSSSNSKSTSVNSNLQLATSCSTVAMATGTTVQLINPYGTKVLAVVCDFDTDGGGWTVIQRRSSGPRHDFDRNWFEYVEGFGTLAGNGNFWLGLENIRTLTKTGDQELRIDLEDFDGNKRYAKYSSFSISDASDFYRLSISGYSGTAGDSIVSYYGDSNDQRFSTKDKDNHNSPSENCGAKYQSGWWFDHCFGGNLNGLYREKGEYFAEYGIVWSTWKAFVNYMAKTQMKIRTRKST